jgi:hypothetical protein
MFHKLFFTTGAIMLLISSHNSICNGEGEDTVKNNVLIVVDMLNDYNPSNSPNYTPEKGYSYVPDWGESSPPASDVIPKIQEMLGFEKENGESYWDLIVFTHDWNDYGAVCQPADNKATMVAVTNDECWQGSEINGGNYVSSLVAWTKGTEVIEDIAESVPMSMRGNRTIHVVKKFANWG